MRICLRTATARGAGSERLSQDGKTIPINPDCLIGSDLRHLRMIPVSRKALPPAGVSRCGSSAANIGGHDHCNRSEPADCPGDVRGGEETVFPIGDSLLGAKTIHVDGDVNRFVFQGRGELFESIAPIFAGHAIESAGNARRLALGPGLDLQLTVFQRTMVREQARRKSKLEIAAAPDAGPLDIWKGQRSVDPSATTPVGRTDVPVGMIVE